MVIIKHREKIYKNAVDIPCTLRVFVFQVHMVQVLNVWLFFYILRASTRSNVYGIFRMLVVDTCFLLQNVRNMSELLFFAVWTDGQREPPLFFITVMWAEARSITTFFAVIGCQRHPFVVHIMIDLHMWITCSKSTWTVQPIISSICLIHSFHLSLSIASREFVSKALPVTLMTMPRTFLHMTLVTSLFHLLT